MHADELIVDNFAGGGGASSGIEAAIGRPVDIAINHSPQAIAMHQANHPETRHFCENIVEIDPVVVCGSRPVGLAWFSPDCTHFSKAKGTKPRDKNIRGLAWVVIRWAKAVAPRVIVLENVEEFETWGPVDDAGQPVKHLAGTTFREWLAELVVCGYEVQFRSLVAADYGAPTTRKRLFLVARRDRAPIVWPEPTHGKGRGRPWRPAAEVIDWSLPCPSIFDRARPLAEATLRRIAAGIRRYVIDGARPFIVRHGHYSTITGAGLREGCGAGTFRGQPLDAPLATVCATNDKHLVCPIVTKHYGGMVGHRVDQPLGTVTTKDHHALTAATLSRAGGGNRAAQVRAFLARYASEGSRVRGLFDLEPGVIRIHGEPYQIVDISMRMLQPRELFAAQGFRPDYVIDAPYAGRTLNKKEQTALAGNSVCPDVAREIVRSNVNAGGRRTAA